MQATQTWKKFYQKLGHLCYAIAAVDNKIAAAEANELKNLVTNEWKDFESTKDEFGEDTAFQIEIVFDWLRDNSPSSEIAFKAFSDFYKEHPGFFSAEIKKKILKTAEAIASAFHGENKKEHLFLQQLNEVLA
jgi:hypothetical protein